MSWSGIILVLVGALLANNFGMLPLGWLHQWWAALLIALGMVSILRPQHGRRRSRERDLAGRPARDTGSRP